MPARTPAPRRRTAAAVAVLAAVLATVPVAAFSGSGARSALGTVPSAAPAAVAPALGTGGRSATGSAIATRPTTPPARYTTADLAPASAAPAVRPAAAVATSTAVGKPVQPARVATRPVARPSPVFVGRDHVWIPDLGISRSVAPFSCTRSQPPGTAVYRWGCAGANNVYLFAHAYAAFAPLHDAYVSGRLSTRLTVVYADGAGRVHRYRVAWWRLTTPDNGAFAYAALSRPGMTLQTCVGAQSQYRLIVRLVQVG